MFGFITVFSLFLLFSVFFAKITARIKVNAYIITFIYLFIQQTFIDHLLFVIREQKTFSSIWNCIKKMTILNNIKTAERKNTNFGLFCRYI